MAHDPNTCQTAPGDSCHPDNEAFDGDLFTPEEIEILTHALQRRPLAVLRFISYIFRNPDFLGTLLDEMQSNLERLQHATEALFVQTALAYHAKGVVKRRMGQPDFRMAYPDDQQEMFSAFRALGLSTTVFETATGTSVNTHEFDMEALAVLTQMGVIRHRQGIRILLPLSRKPN